MNRLSDIDWFIFDLVGTVLHVAPSVSAIYSEVASELGVIVGPVEIERRFPVAVSQCFHTETHTTNRSDQKQRWRCTVANCFPGTPSELQEKIFESLWKRLQCPSSWRFDPQWSSLVRNLKERGYRIAIASNFDNRIYKLVKSIPEVSAGVGKIFCSADIGWVKPHQQFFSTIATSLSCSPQRLCMIGDSLEDDYQGATQAGWQAFLLDSNLRFPSNKDRITRLQDLLTLL